MSTGENIPLKNPAPLHLADKDDALLARLGLPREPNTEQSFGTWIEQEDEFDRLTWEAIADAEDAGNLIAHEEVEAWVDSLIT